MTAILNFTAENAYFYCNIRKLVQFGNVGMRGARVVEPLK